MTDEREEQDGPDYEPMEAGVLVPSEFDLETIEHIGELMRQVVRDDPMFNAKYGKRIEESWNPAEVAENIVTRLMLRCIVEMVG